MQCQPCPRPLEKLWYLEAPANVQCALQSLGKEHNGVTTTPITSDAEQDKISSNFNGETDSLSKATDNGDTAFELNELKFE